MENTKAPASRCDFCAYYDYDEESEQYVCEINLDEDEMVNFLSIKWYINKIKILKELLQ